MKNLNIVSFIFIAPKEAAFYFKIGELLIKNNAIHDVVFISLCDPGIKHIKNFKVYSTYNFLNKNQPTFNWNIPISKENFILHERITFGIKSKELLYKKSINYLTASASILKKIQRDYNNYNITVFQEVGGFIGPLSYFYNALNLKIRHVFFESSFYNDRVNFCVNTLETNVANLIPKIEEVSSIITGKKNTSSISIPRHLTHLHSRMTVLKTFNTRNFSKIFYKLYHKYIRRQKQEYDKVLNHVIENLKSNIRHFLNKSIYSNKLKTNSKKIIFFPFHVPYDFALTTREPKYLDQLKLVEEIIKIIPNDWIFVAKEHPTSVGKLSHKRLKDLSRNKNFLLLDPNKTNTYKILEKASVALVINSKVGIEALSYNKKVISLGKTIYMKHPNNYFCSNIESFLKILNYCNKKPFEADNKCIFSGIWETSYPGEIYDMNSDNIVAFSNSIIDFLTSNKS